MQKKVVPMFHVPDVRRTVDWYRDNEWWWEPVRSGEYRDYYERHYGRALR